MKKVLFSELPFLSGLVSEYPYLDSFTSTYVCVRENGEFDIVFSNNEDDEEFSGFRFSYYPSYSFKWNWYVNRMSITVNELKLMNSIVDNLDDIVKQINNL